MVASAASSTHLRTTHACQVIQAGSFGGCYFNPRGGRPGIYGPSVDVTHEEFPADWFEGLADDQYRGRRYQISRNKYGVRPQPWSTAAVDRLFVVSHPRAVMNSESVIIMRTVDGPVNQGRACR